MRADSKLAEYRSFKKERTPILSPSLVRENLHLNPEEMLPRVFRTGLPLHIMHLCGYTGCNRAFRIASNRNENSKGLRPLKRGWPKGRLVAGTGLEPAISWA